MRQQASGGYAVHKAAQPRVQLVDRVSGASQLGAEGHKLLAKLLTLRFGRGRLGRLNHPRPLALFLAYSSTAFKDLDRGLGGIEGDVVGRHQFSVRGKRGSHCVLARVDVAAQVIGDPVAWPSVGPLNSVHQSRVPLS